jgi:hypothetical protein
MDALRPPRPTEQELLGGESYTPPNSSYLVGTGLRRLLLQDAVAVALAAGYDVADWPVDVVRGDWLEAVDESGVEAWEQAHQVRLEGAALQGTRSGRGSRAIG